MMTVRTSRGLNVTVAALFPFSVLVAISALGCSRASVIRGPEGIARLSCERGMKDCVNQAERICGDDGYQVLSGSSHKIVLGAQTSAYRSVSEAAELEIRCGAPVVDEKRKLTFKLPPRQDSYEGEPQSEAAPSNACVPGETQRCFGPGACTGAQICQADGGSFGACDCGGPAAPAQGAGATSDAPEKQGDAAPPADASQKKFAPEQSEAAPAPAPTTPQPQPLAP